MIFVRFLTFLTSFTFYVEGFRPDVLVEKGNYSNFHVVIDENVRVDTCKCVRDIQEIILFKRFTQR